MVWYSHLLKNFPQLIVIHTVKGFGIVNKAEIDAFLELSCFFCDPADVGNFSPQRRAIIDLLRGGGGHHESSISERWISERIESRIGF